MADDDTQEGPAFLLDAYGEELGGRQFEVGADGLLVGRSPSCDVIFQSREVSRRHAYFYPDGRSCYVKDLGSRNGILVNGRPAKVTGLSDGDEVEIGAARFVMRIEGSGSDSAGRLWGPYGAEAAPERLAAPRHFLAGASVVWGLLTYLHWAFGFGAAVLALLALHELRKDRDLAGTALALGGLAMGLCGGAMNAWFGEIAPRLREQSETRARAACRQNLDHVARALAAYERAHDGALPNRLGELAQEGFVEAGWLRCPGSALEGGGPRPYLFVRSGPGLSMGGARAIVGDAEPSYHQGRGGWVLKVDGHVDWLPAERFERLLSELEEAGRGPAQGAPRPEER
ncbi:MAG: FHA domain-containing protein [Planctomycetota bacterium]|jgi:hypothetical protein